ncbi:SWIM zinc finger family protein [Desulfobacterales bacterium HSG16]|nr:SWIM zinc finger family protein [Desulfobacterales bacterium HSG16]
MSYYYYAPYVTVAEKKAKAAKKLAQLKKKNPGIEPITIEGRSIAKSWWGKSWNSNLERYADYTNRIARGRSYVRNGMVLDLKLDKGKVTALVQGTASKPYSITIKIKEIDKDTWKKIKKACQGKLDSLPKLLGGKIPKDLAEILTAKGKGLFPSPKEIKFNCSCPDWAYMCKHVAAALYGIGARLDNDPMLFFKLRNADVEDLVSEAVKNETREILDKAGKKSKRVIKNADLSDMFGIELEESPKLQKAKTAKKKPVTAAKKKPVTAAKKKPVTAAKKKPVTAAKKKPVTAAKKKPVTAAKVVKSDIDIVEAVIRRSRNGVDTMTLMAKTGFNEKKIYNLIYRLKKQDKIINIERGVYMKVS